MSHAYLKLDHITKTFQRGAAVTEVLADISLTIDKGEYVSIIGHSGCGKSTLLNIVAGLTPVTKGAVLLENQEVNSPDPTARWCSRTTRCCPGSPSTRTSRSR